MISAEAEPGLARRVGCATKSMTSASECGASTYAHQRQTKRAIRVGSGYICFSPNNSFVVTITSHDVLKDLGPSRHRSFIGPWWRCCRFFRDHNLVPTAVGTEVGMCHVHSPAVVLQFSSYCLLREKTKPLAGLLAARRLGSHYCPDLFFLKKRRR